MGGCVHRPQNSLLISFPETFSENYSFGIYQMLNVYHLFWPFWLTQTAQGARPVYGVARGLPTADGIDVHPAHRLGLGFRGENAFNLTTH